MNFRRLLLACALLTLTTPLWAQSPPEDWHLLDPQADGYAGISLNKANKLLKKSKRKPTPVVVAIIDSGLDIDHEDLKKNLWTNADEKPDNGEDDDDNGYADDVHGWNFIGGTDGRNVTASTSDETRLYRSYRERFAGQDRYTVAPADQQDYRYYLFLEEQYEQGKAGAEQQLEMARRNAESLDEVIPPLRAAIGKDQFDQRDLERLRPDDPQVEEARGRVMYIMGNNENLVLADLLEYYDGLQEQEKSLAERLEYNYNLEFDDREIVGDNYADLSERYYGNADLSQRAFHGTHVAGIVGAVRGNRKGMDGIAAAVQLMPIRAVPMGDERDKDIANAIRYAVDNGARVINMSFGKDHSLNKAAVDEAVRYAAAQGVLLVHGAGNDGRNLDRYFNYPTALFEDGTVADNWLEVGASGPRADEDLPASFSNYGQKSVDLFAPGVEIYSTSPGDEYERANGTSMASPVVAGVAALLLSYFPELTPIQVRELLVETGTSYADKTVTRPGDGEVVPFGELSRSGRVVNAYQAVQRALEMYAPEG